MWTPSQRNWDKIQFEKLRKIVDGAFNQIHDELSDCYYNYWRLGKSKPFRNYDVQPTLEESKTLFDKLHGLIFHLRNIKFHQENLKQPANKKINESRYNDILDDTGKVGGKISDLCAQKIAELKSEGFELII